MFYGFTQSIPRSLLIPCSVSLSSWCISFGTLVVDLKMWEESRRSLFYLKTETGVTIVAKEISKLKQQNSRNHPEFKSHKPPSTHNYNRTIPYTSLPEIFSENYQKPKISQKHANLENCKSFCWNNLRKTKEKMGRLLIHEKDFIPCVLTVVLECVSIFGKIAQAIEERETFNGIKDLILLKKVIA